MSINIVETFKAARRVNTPLVAIATADQQATIATLVEAVNGAPKFQWDAIHGLRPMDEASEDALVTAANGTSAADIAANTGNPAPMLDIAERLPAKSVTFMVNAHRFIEESVVSTGVLNLRDPYKGNKRTFVLLAPAFTLPTELQQSVVLLDEPLPNDDELGDVLAKLGEGVKQGLKVESTESAVQAARGLSRFMAEQTFAMAIRKDGTLDLADTWERKRTAINQIPGLTLETEGPSFDDIAGLSQIRKFMAAVFGGKNSPAVILRIEEIEKMFAGAAGDTSGTSGDALGQILSVMEDYGWTGFLAAGPGGSGKSLVSKAIGREFKRPVLVGDINATKSKWVGGSEQQIRTMLKTVNGIAGGRPVLVVGTCNKLDALPPELRRRFKMGIWYFDLPTADELDSILSLYVERCGITDEQLAGRPDFTGWTGAEIRNVCERARDLGISIAESAEYTVPVIVSDPESVRRLRSLANGRFLDASAPGPYRTSRATRMDVAAPAPARTIGDE